ncbi:MAG: DNA primase, partial [Lachnospiraceae bacterium]|nr:DNA primase [Lachnospiraceae bacterium]
MRYTDDLIEEVRSRNDIVDIIGENVRLTRAGNSYKGLCPFHNERTPSFHVDRSKQMYYCFGCHAGGNIFTFLREYNNMSFTEAIQYLADRAGVTL